MSTDKLADTIYSLADLFNPELIETMQSIVPVNAAARVRERFVVIDRNDLPEVEELDDTHNLVGLNPFSKTSDPDALTREGLRYLAMAEHLRKSPPVDEKAVKELAAELWEPLASSSAAYDLARALVADGWKREVTP